MSIGRLGMTCPSCHVELKIASREGVEIDYCPECRGVWLERGELDKIIDRVMNLSRDPVDRAYSRRYEDDDDDRYRRGERPYRKRKRSFLGDLFDFD